MKLWDKAQRAMDTVYDQTTIQALVDQDENRSARSLDSVREKDGKRLPNGSPMATRAGD